MTQIQRLCFYTFIALLLAMLVTACGSGSSSTSSQTVTSSALPAIYYAHSIAFRNHTAMTWGYNGYGQLGNGTNTTSATPTAVPGLVGVIDGDVGGTHTVVFQNISGHVGVRTWGNNAYGQLGDGTQNASAIPVRVQGLNGIDISSVAAGGNHTLALSAGGTVWAWGQNIYGQLGVGDNTGINWFVPVKVGDEANGSPFTGVKAISAGGSHSLALTTDGKVWAWGYNGYGQLGQQDANGRTANSDSPLAVMSNYSGASLTGVKMIKAGGSHNVALKADGTVWTWGYNGFSQLGTDSANTIDPVTKNSFRTLPKQVQEITDTVLAVAAGLDHTLALTSDGIVWAWGFNGYGQLGNNTTKDSAKPVKVQVLGADGKTAADLTSVKRIFAVGHHNYAVKNDGTVWAWGNNTTLQLGIAISSNTNRFSTVAIKVPDLILP